MCHQMVRGLKRQQTTHTKKTLFVQKRVTQIGELVLCCDNGGRTNASIAAPPNVEGLYKFSGGFVPMPW